MNDKPIGSRDHGWRSQGVWQIPTLEQHNFQLEMQARMNRQPAGVLCPCGTEMVYSEQRDSYNISHGNPNCLCPGRSPNVACPACGKTGFKMEPK